MVIQPFDGLCVFLLCVAYNPNSKHGIMTSGIGYDLPQMVVISWLYLIFNYDFSSGIRLFCKNINTIPTDVCFCLYKFQIYSYCF